MLVPAKLAADFSRECAGKRIGHSLFATHPHPAIRELTDASLDDRSMALRALREEHGRALALALAMGASRRTPSSIVKALPTVPSTLPWSTEGENNRRVVVVAVVLSHRADLPVSVKTRPWYVRTDRLPKLPKDSQLLLITEHRLAS